MINLPQVRWHKLVLVCFQQAFSSPLPKQYRIFHTDVYIYIYIHIYIHIYIYSDIMSQR